MFTKIKNTFQLKNKPTFSVSILAFFVLIAVVTGAYLVFHSHAASNPTIVSGQSYNGLTFNSQFNPGPLSNVTIANSTFNVTGSEQAAILLNQSASNITFENDTFQSADWNDVSINNDASSGISIHDITFTGDHFLTAGRMGFECTDASDPTASGTGFYNIKILNSVFDPQDSEAISWSGGAGSGNGCVVDGTIIYGSDQTDTEWQGLYEINGSVNITLSNSTVYAAPYQLFNLNGPSGGGNSGWVFSNDTVDYRTWYGTKNPFSTGYSQILYTGSNGMNGSVWTNCHFYSGSSSGQVRVGIALTSNDNNNDFSASTITGTVNPNCNGNYFELGGSYSNSETYLTNKLPQIVTGTSSPAPTASFSASPATISSGSSSTLTWSTSNATSVAFSPSIGSTSLSGSATVSPTTTTTYTMTATGDGGTTTQTATVNVNTSTPKPTVTISANPTSITSGSSTKLTWSTTNATSVSFSPSVGSTALSGTASVSPTTGTTYTITASGAGGSTSANVSVAVTQATQTPSPASPSSPSTTPDYMNVYRFYDVQNGTHFYTASATEKDMIISKWPNVYNYEGVSYTINVNNPVNNAPLYRFYDVENGDHFYTASASEKNTIIAKWPNIYQYEGITYYVSTTTGTPVYRFYDTQNGSHFFTASATEKAMVEAKWPTIYQYEGVAFYIGD